MDTKRFIHLILPESFIHDQLNEMIRDINTALDPLGYTIPFYKVGGDETIKVYGISEADEQVQGLLTGLLTTTAGNPPMAFTRIQFSPDLPEPE